MKRLLSIGVMAIISCGAPLSFAQYGSSSSTPTKQVNPLAGPRKSVTDAQAVVVAINQKIAAMKSKVEDGFSSQDDWITAKKDLAAAQKAYEAALAPVLAKLHASPEYQHLVDERKQCQATLDDIKSGKFTPDPNSTKTVDDVANDAAGKMVTDGYALNKMESDAKDADPGISEAKAKLDAARKVMDTLKAQVDATLQGDPGYAALQTQLVQAQTQLAQAKQQLALAEKSQKTSAAANKPQRPSSSGGYGSSSGSRPYGG